MVIHQQFPDFVLFLYIHIALTEGAMNQGQEAAILEKMKRLFPDSVELEEKLNTETRKYYDFDKRKLRALFKDTFRSFSKISFIRRYWVCSDLYDIACVGANGSENHSKAMEAVKDIIDISL